MRLASTVRLALGYVTLVAFVACGDSNDDDGKTYSLDSVCEEIVPTICARREQCCSASGIGFDRAGCEAREMNICQQNRQDVDSGLMSFDGSKVDACIEAFDALLADCRIPLAKLVTRLDRIDVCSQVWAGQKDVGAACARSAECRPSSDPNTFTSCSDQGRCQRLQIVGDGASCSLLGDDLRLCQPGSYCDVQLAGTSSCKPAVATGQSCDPLQQDCSFGSYCSGSSQTCVAQHAAGEDCIVATQCQSLSCSAGSCDPVEPVVDQLDCLGS